MAALEIPKIISVDDHVIEPPNVWQDRLPAKYKEVGPRVERHAVKDMSFIGGKFSYEMGEPGEGPEADWWLFEDKAIPHTRLAAAVGVPREEVTVTPITYEDMRPGCYDQKARLEDMDANWTEAQMCFPTMPRFTGQTFTEMADQELGLLCVQAYNDWQVDEWCAGTDGRLIPLMIPPLWDAKAAADEVRRMAARGVTATCFTEIPPFLGLPSIHSGEWDPFFEACDETGVVVNMHIGSSSKMPSTSPDAPPLVGSTMTFTNCMMSMVDFLMSGVLVRFPNVKLAYAEGQLGWIPYILERADKVWHDNRAWGGVGDSVPEPPSTYYYRQIYACFFDDEFGLQEHTLAKVGEDNAIFETDYPHSDSTWPHTKEVATKLMSHLPDETVRKLVRGNAIKLLNLDFTPVSAVDAERDYKLLIGGEWVRAGDGAYPIINPSTGQVVGQAPNASVADAESAAAAAAEAFPAWSRTTPEERANLLEKAADLLDQRYPDLVPIVQAETGATLRVTKQMQVPMAAVRLRRYAKGIAAEQIIPIEPGVMPTTALAPGGLIGGVARRAPVGVVACITSYNFPLTNMAGKIGPALAMGNTVVVKPAPQDPLGIVAMAEVFTDAGFPPGVVNFVVSEGPAPAEALVASKHVDMVSFTGSTGVGRQIGAAAGGDMKRLLLELGGKGACIVFDDADIKAAVTGITSVWAFHSGQICTSPTRVLAQRGIYDQLVSALSGAAARFKVGDPLEKDTVVGPVITGVHRDRIESYIQSGRDEGGTITAGGDRVDVHGDGSGNFLQPTLIADCKPGMRVVQEEIFGPVIVVVPFDDAEEAPALANSTDFGLYDYVFSTDTARAYAVAQQLRTGNVGINTVQRNHELPFGGFKQSGVGRDGGKFGFHAYSELQSIVFPS